MRAPREDESPGRDAPLALPGDECLDAPLGGANAVGVLPRVAVNVVPGGHHVAVVDGHCLHRSVREDEAGAEPRWEGQLGNDRLEVVAVGAQAVQPDDGRVHGPAGGEADFDLERVQQVRHARAGLGS